MVTSLLLCLHHAVTGLILNTGTVGTELLTPHPPAKLLREMTK